MTDRELVALMHGYVSAPPLSNPSALRPERM